MASYVHARQHQGTWLLRIEDVDETRIRAGAAADIQRTLENLGFEWDEQVMFQSQRKQPYAEAIESLLKTSHAYPCACSRSDIATNGLQGAEGWIYPGSCRNGIAHGKKPRTIRLRTHDQPIEFQDMILGPQSHRIESETGDFVIRRADGYTAYQLAVVVDDEDQGITHVVRGADLLGSTARQIHLQQILGFSIPQYAHVPLVLDEQGRKLSKQDDAHPVSTADPLQSLRSASQFLYNTTPPPELDSVSEFWRWLMQQPATRSLFQFDL